MSEGSLGAGTKQHPENIYATESGHVPDRRHSR